MFKLVKQLSDIRIQKKVNNSLKPENKDYVIFTIDYIDREINYVDSIIGQEASDLKAEIMQIGLSTSLSFVYNEDKLEFLSKKDDNEDFIIKYQDGKFVVPSLNGTNSILLNIVNKYIDKFNSIALKYQKIQPFLKHRHKLYMAKEIVLGNTLYDAYLKEYNYSLEAKKELKRIKRNIMIIKENLFSKTGWYELEQNVFASIDANDVDNKVVNAVILKDKWVPSSCDDKNKYIEEEFISNNNELLSQYRTEYRKISKINEKQGRLNDNIEKQILERNNIIEKVKIKKNSESKKQLTK